MFVIKDGLTSSKYNLYKLYTFLLSKESVRSALGFGSNHPKFRSANTENFNKCLTYLLLSIRNLKKKASYQVAHIEFNK